MGRKRWLLIGAIILTSAAQAYEIRVRRPFVKKADVHETITALAEECLKTPSAAAPSGCWHRNADLAGRSRSRGNESYGPLQVAVRWPDDPTRQDRKASFLKIGYNLFRGCKKLAAGSRVIEEIGLLCSSHYGKLQFFHAQAVDEDKSPADTRRRILAWADLAFRIATDARLEDGSRLLDANYCRFIETEPAALSEVMRCKSPSIYDDWNVSTFFALTCASPWVSYRCPTPGEAAEEDRLAILSAKGALLHLVQDSFSQSHASRSIGSPIPPNGPQGGFVSKVVCAYPTAYFNYREQKSKAHGKADRPPVRDSSCDDDPRTPAPDDPQTDDVITASAMILWHLENGSPESFERYLVDRVFGPEPTA
ncbi:MAG TPA: hypothetical protein VE053_12850 [Allosphingosinicella sp.]|nr:hypothetical protein [Allosphingosinicella sp.]